MNLIQSADGDNIAEILPTDCRGQANENSALIAAAPDMLSALWDALDTIENMLADLCDEPEEDIEANNTIATIQAAIARATGGN
jgi:hypothetical protein